MEENKNISKIFELKAPSDIFESQINSLVIYLSDLIDLHYHTYINEPTYKYQNRIIDDMIAELNTMKVIEYEGE